MDLSLVAQFWVVAVLLALTPGPDWAYVIAAGLRARSVAPSVLGLLTGYAVVIAVVAVGIGALVARCPLVLTVLTVLGAAYLLWLGLTTLFGRVRRVAADGASVVGSPAAQFGRGALVSGINPKGLLLLLALLPQFTTPAGYPSSVQMLVLGGLHLADCAAVYFAVGLLARHVLRSRGRAAGIVTRLAGIAMTAIGVLILVERVQPWV